jgi:hypothetical protein
MHVAVITSHRTPCIGATLDAARTLIAEADAAAERAPATGGPWVRVGE